MVFRHNEKFVCDLLLGPQSAIELLTIAMVLARVCCAAMRKKEDYGNEGWRQQNWEQRRTWLRRRFNTGDITEANRRELEHYLVHLASEPDKVKYDEPAETKRFAVVIEQLLQARIGEQVSRRSTWISLVAIAISVLGIVVRL